MYEINRNASVEYTPRARTLEFLTAIAWGGTEFRSQVFLGASVHGYIFIGEARLNRRGAFECVLMSHSIPRIFFINR